MKKKRAIKTKISGAPGFKEQTGGHSLPGRLEWSSREAGVKTRKEGLVSKNNKTTEISEGNVESLKIQRYKGNLWPQTKLLDIRTWRLQMFVEKKVSVTLEVARDRVVGVKE